MTPGWLHYPVELEPLLVLLVLTAVAATVQGARHVGVRCDVLHGMPKTRPATAPAASAPDAPRTPQHLRVLFELIEVRGSGSPVFWHTFRQVLPTLTRPELERVALAAGKRGHAVFQVLVDPMQQGNRSR